MFASIRPAPQAAKAATLATKGKNIGTQHIESGQTSRQERYHPQAIIAMFIGKPDNSIFTVEAREEGEATNRERSNQPCDSSNWHLWGKATHQTHILYLSMHGMVQRMQHAASSQEEQCFEEGMGKEVEHTRARTQFARYAQTYKHIA